MILGVFGVLILAVFGVRVALICQPIVSNRHRRTDIASKTTAVVVRSGRSRGHCWCPTQPAPSRPAGAPRSSRASPTPRTIRMGGPGPRKSSVRASWTLGLGTTSVWTGLQGALSRRHRGHRVWTWQPCCVPRNCRAGAPPERVHVREAGDSTELTFTPDALLSGSRGCSSAPRWTRRWMPRPQTSTAPGAIRNLAPWLAREN